MHILVATKTNLFSPLKTIFCCNVPLRGEGVCAWQWLYDVQIQQISNCSVNFVAFLQIVLLAFCCVLNVRPHILFRLPPIPIRKRRVSRIMCHLQRYKVWNNSTFYIQTLWFICISRAIKMFVCVSSGLTFSNFLYRHFSVHWVGHHEQNKCIDFCILFFRAFTKIIDNAKLQNRGNEPHKTGNPNTKTFILSEFTRTGR